MLVSSDKGRGMENIPLCLELLLKFPFHLFSKSSSAVQHRSSILDWYKSGHTSLFFFFFFFCPVHCEEEALSYTISYSWAVVPIILNVHEKQLACYLSLFKGTSKSLLYESYHINLSSVILLNIFFNFLCVLP